MSAAIAPFTGFPAEGFQFLRDLAANNERSWFEAHKEAYLHAVQAPAVALVATLGAQIQARFPEISYDIRSNGTGSLMRIYRDTRFSTDKAPYKTNVAMMFTPGGAKKMSASGFGLQITPEQIDLVAGIFAFTPADLVAYRAAVLDDIAGPELEGAAAAVRAAGAYRIEGIGYKRIPAGLPASHPRAEWLKYKGLHAFAPPAALAVALTPELVDHAMAHFVAMAPLQQWLMRATTRPNP